MESQKEIKIKNFLDNFRELNLKKSDLININNGLK